MRNPIFARVVGVFAVLCVACSARAQLEGLTAIAYDWQSETISRDAAHSLGMTTTWRTTEDGFIAALRGGTFDLVILDLSSRVIVRRAEMLAEFESHIAGGGRLMVNYPELDLWPELQELLRVRTVQERLEPAPHYPPPPGNPIWGGGNANLPEDDRWPDNGDTLEPTESGFVVAVFDSPMGEPASVIRGDRMTLVNGFDWDSLNFGAGFGLARQQITYLFSCRPDLDPDQNLDIFDFLRFQNLWDQGSRFANRNFDSVFDVFDFLEFQNEFAAGCD